MKETTSHGQRPSATISFVEEVFVNPDKRHFWLITLLLPVFGALAIGQEVTQLRVVKEERIPASVYEQVAVGGPRDNIQCGENQSLWIPASRGYSETVSSLMHYSRKETIRIDIDAVPELARGSIEYYSPSPDGSVFALVRSVKQSSFAVEFSRAGKELSIVRLLVEQGRPVLSKLTGLAKLENGWMLVGSMPEGDNIRIGILEFDSSGKFRSSLDLPNNVAKANHSKSAPTSAVFRPTVVNEPDGTFLVLRGFSDQSVYHVSRTGELLGTIKLDPDGFDFWSPRIDGNRLFVEVELAQPQIGEIEGISVVKSRAAFALFDLSTGRLSNVLTLDGDSGGSSRLLQK